MGVYSNSNAIPGFSNLFQCVLGSVARTMRILNLLAESVLQRHENPNFSWFSDTNTYGR